MPSEPIRSRAKLVGLLLGVQLAAIAAAPLEPRMRTLAWAPFHEPATFRIHVRVGGRELSEAEVTARYGLPTFHPGRQLNDVRNVFDVVEAHESGKGRADGAVVRVEYRRGHGPTEVWRWPR